MAAFVVMGLIGVLLLLDGCGHQRQRPGPSPLRAFEGVGTWIDNWDWPTWGRPDHRGQAYRIVTAMRRRGVRTLFMATSHHSQPTAIVRPVAVGRVLEAAHRQGMRVVAWYQPSLARPGRDLRRALAAIRFRSRQRQAFDGFALDIEDRSVGAAGERNARLVRFTRELRRAAGAAYPLAAIVPSPVQLRKHPNSWPGFPYRALARDFDAFLPMAYWAHEAVNRRPAYDWTAQTIRLLRRSTGRPDLPIAVIGGPSRLSDSAEVRGFVDAAAACRAIGLSLFDFLTTSRAEWRALSVRPTSDPPGTERRSC